MKLSAPVLVTLLSVACTSTASKSEVTTKTHELTPIPTQASMPAPKKVEPERKAAALPKTLDEALASNFRRPENKVRDNYRHPYQTLQFFGLKNTMNVVEVLPGGGWYEEILAPYLAQKGHYTAARGAAASDSDATQTLVKQHPELSSRVSNTVMDLKTEADIAPAQSADMVLTFRNVHNWMARNNEHKAFAAFYKALKPGGILGVVEHRGNPNIAQVAQAKTGYVREDEVIKIAEKAGFKLLAKSEINANSKDTKDHPEGVWTLPPTLKLGQTDREKYVAIGESDRMTLKFVKPKIPASVR